MSFDRNPYRFGNGREHFKKIKCYTWMTLCGKNSANTCGWRI